MSAFSPLCVYIFGFLSFYFCSFKLRCSFLLPLSDDSLYWGGGASHLEMISLQPATPATLAEMVSSKDSKDYLTITGGTTFSLSSLVLDMASHCAAWLSCM